MSLAFLAAIVLQTDARASQVDALFAQYSTTPGAAVAVVERGRTVLSRGYGVADVSTGRRITPDTAFDLASLSKPFTSLAVLRLAAHGRIKLEDEVTAYLPEIAKVASGVTVGHLLNHTGGLPDYMLMFRLTGKTKGVGPAPSTTERPPFEPTARDVVTIVAEKGRAQFKPGEKFLYSNTGYVLLGQIVEKTSGKRLAEFLHDEVFRPLGMTNTLLRDERLQPIKNRAHSYETSDAKTDIDYTDLNLIYGDGNVNTTANDMAKFAIALDAGKVLPEPWRSRAWSPTRLNDGTTTEYGLGWTVFPWGDRTGVGHSGGWVGFRTTMLHLPRERVSVIVLSNLRTMDTDVLAGRILEIYAGEAR